MEDTVDDLRAERIGKALSKALGRTSGPKNQHYVTRAYQELFLGKNGKLAVYDRITEKFFFTGRDGVASANEFYAFTDNEGNKRFDVEHALGVFESDAIPIIKRLCKRNGLDTFERSMLSWYIAANLLRTPQALDELRRGYEALAPLLRDHFEDEAAARKFYEDQKMHPLRAAERAAIIFGRAELKPGRQAALGLFFEALPIVFSRIDRSRWLILESLTKAGTFVISDCGVAQIAYSQESIGNLLAPGIQFAFPLSADRCLVSIYSTGQISLEYKEVDHKLVTSINWATAWASRRHVMGSFMPQIKDIATVLSTIPAGWIPVFAVE
jgi:hypothetical protein